MSLVINLCDAEGFPCELTQSQIGALVPLLNAYSFGHKWHGERVTKTNVGMLALRELTYLGITLGIEQRVEQ